MHVLITGACGWLGRSLTACLETAGHDLRLLDSARPEDATVFVAGASERARMPLQLKHPFVHADITDPDAMLRACESIDAVVHLATLPSGEYALGKQIIDASITGTYVTMDAARRQGVKRLLYASSINAFGTIYWRVSGKPATYTSMPLRETHFTPVPEDPYSLGKWVNELTAAMFHRAFGDQPGATIWAGFRFAGVWPDAIFQSHRAKLKDLKTEAWNDDLYQYVHVDDVVAGLRQALECPALPPLGVYTLGAPDTRQPEPTMEILQRFRPDLAANLTEPLPGRAPLMSITHARQTFGYDPQHRVGP